MLRYFLRSAVLLAFLVCASSFNPNLTSQRDIVWHTWDDAIALNKTEQKKIFVDLYTNWCGWCKRMDKTTFKDEALVKYMSENFIAVKLNAEQKEAIKYKDHEFKFVSSGRRGYHELAYSLLEGKMSYPSFVFLDENEQRITISPGYKVPADMLKQMIFIGEEHYKTKTFEAFSKEYKAD